MSDEKKPRFKSNPVIGTNQPRPKNRVPGKEVGDRGEILVEQELNRSLYHNFDREQPHANRRPDFSVHDDSGERVAFLESKARNAGWGRATKHDFKQTLSNIKLTREFTSSKELHIAVDGGKEFFTADQHAAIKHEQRNDVRVMMWDRRSQMRQMASHLNALVKTSSAKHHLQGNLRDHTNSASPSATEQTSTTPSNSIASPRHPLRTRSATPTPPQRTAPSRGPLPSRAAPSTPSTRGGTPSLGK